MKVALYHNLPPGGARRALWEFVRRTAGVHDYHLFTVDMGRADEFTYARSHGEQQDLSPFVAAEHRYPLLRGAAARLPLGKLTPLEAARRMPAVEREIARDINAGGFDVAYVHPCRLAHTPSVLRHLEVPSLHYMQEPRRQSFEAGYRPGPRLSGPATFPRWAATTVLERALRSRDALAAAAADRIAANSHYSAECIRRAYGRQATVCYLGVDDLTFTASAGRPDGPPQAVAVGALDRPKGQHLVVAALGLLPAGERPVLHLVFERCDEAYRREVEDQARSLGVELCLHRGITDAELAALYRSTAVTVLTATLEPFGLVVLESLACGVPVVALREAGYRETLHDGVNGYLVGREVIDIAEGVRRVLSGSLAMSPAELRNTVVPRWSWDASVKHQLALLESTARGET
jgi:glycosyltransferase involved in cell wall biosynthesis